MTRERAFEKLRGLGTEITLLSHAGAVLGWDQEIFMPEEALEERASQLALLSTLVHERVTGEQLGFVLESLEGIDCSSPDGDLSWQDRGLLRMARRVYERAVKLPAGFVADLSRAASLGQASWAKAREAGDFSLFRDRLNTLIELKKQEAALIDSAAPAYDVLLDEYEPGMKAETLARVFTELRAELVPFLRQVLEQGARLKADKKGKSFLDRDYPVAKQEAFGTFVLEKMGYDFRRGRLDVSTHPFTTTLGRKDVRITTRYDERSFSPGLYSIIHEGGHALYEMGFDENLDDLCATGTSLGIHESQSRTWENLIGRSQAFWEYFLPHLKRQFPGVLDDADVDSLWREINKVETSFIRVDADELSYSLHVILRFELESALFRGDLKVDELPKAWKDKSRELLGIVPPDDKKGVLQDIHWSMGSFGYFPTYALGNLYGAMFFRAAERRMPGLQDDVRKGDFGAFRSWLRENIHRYGAAKTPDELLREICGAGLDSKPFVDYLKNKYSLVYDLL